MTSIRSTIASAGKRATQRLAALASSLARCRRGNVAVVFAMGAVPVIVGAGMGIDMARAYAVKVRLGAALDQAALAVGASDQTNQTLLQQRLQNYFYANYPATALGTPPLPTMTVDPTDKNIINFTAHATVPTAFMKIVGIDNLAVNVTNQVTRGVSGLEIALVLDNTGSMLCGDALMANCSSGVPPSHITSLITDAKQVVNTLFQNTTDLSKLKISIVPYVTTVNVGPAFSQKGLLTGASMTYSGGVYKDIHGATIKDFSNNPITYDATQTENTREWRGCVIEPTTSNEDVTGVGPDITEPAGGWTGPWTPFYWLPNTRASGTNDWNLTTKPIQYLHTDGNVNSAWSSSRGPNNGCPSPLVRLTNDQTTLINALGGLKSWAAGGTQIHIGMIWGWRTLSPYPPFADGQAYGTPNWKKAVVLMTDGQNELPDANHLTGLSFLADGKFGSIVQNTALANLDARLRTVCRNMGAEQIVIYTVGLGAGSTGSAAKLLQDCAASGYKDSQYFAAATAADLQAAFQQIALALNNLRLSR